MLIGEKSLSNAWAILTRLYGNKTMLANKLKGKLKDVKVSGKEDHDIIINLCIEVKSIICSLTELGMQEMLKYDDEYLSAVFRALPSQERTMWLKFEKVKFGSEWEAMENFLDKAHEEATTTKVLLSNYAAKELTNEGIKSKKCHKIGHKKNECPDTSLSIAATKTRVKNDSDDDSSDKVLESEKQKAKELAGQCPHCKSSHTFRRRRDNIVWPSDRFTTGVRETES